MRRAVLVDTGPLYAAVDPDDQYHSRAQQELEQLNQEGFAVLLLYPILLEAYTLILYRLGQQAANTWRDEVTMGTALINPTSDDYAAALIMAGTYPDQKITLFDSILAVSAKRLGYSVWTYDHHFDVMQSKVWR